MGAQQSKDEMLYNEVQNGNIEAVRALHSSGAGLEWMDKKGRTPLILACTRGDSLELILALLNLGANLNAHKAGSHGGTPLHYAAKQGHDKIVTLLLDHGANPLVTNQMARTRGHVTRVRKARARGHVTPLQMAKARGHVTPLQMARARGRVSVVRLIEGRISLFCGMIRELSGPGFLEALAPQLVSRKIWAVVLPSASNNPRMAPRFELVIYSNPKVSRPRTIIWLSKVEIEEPEFSLPDPMLILFDQSTKTRYKFLSETEGDKKQLQRLYEACKGTHQQCVSVTASENPPIPEDVELAMAINASLQSSAKDGNQFSGAPQQGSLTSDFNGWGSMTGSGGSEWGPPESTEMPINSDKCNGWGVDETGPSNIADGQTTDSVCGPSLPENAFPAHKSISAPSAPPLPDEYTADSDGPIMYPSIDISPIEVNLADTEDHRAQPSTSSNQSQGNSSGSCVICWDAPAEAVCIPCGHLAGCMSCLNDVKGKKWGCPVCRSSIEQLVKVYAVGLDK